MDDDCAYSAEAQARRLGYLLLVAPSDAAPWTHKAFAQPLTGTRFTRSIAYGRSATDAAERGLEVLRSTAAHG